MEHQRSDYDVVFAGGGLHSGLASIALLRLRPDLRIALFEQEKALGGEHTWCFHDGDVDVDGHALLADLVCQRWDGYDVRFPRLERRLPGPYFAIASRRLDEVVTAAFAKRPDCLLATGMRTQTMAPTHVVTEDGRVVTARLIVDGRGALPPASHGSVAKTDEPNCGYQKFFGVELRLTGPHGLSEPLLMDATVPQTDGYRFMYVLPWGIDHLLVEDTCFSRDANLDKLASERAIGRYLAARDWTVTERLRTESGVLPMPWRSDFETPTASPLVLGFRGGWFHPATGYSLPIAVRLARHLVEHAPDRVFGPAMDALFAQVRSQAAYAQHLNRLLFHLFAPEQMWNVFERFYRLPEDVIARFYGLSLRRMDQARILGGRPPRGMSLSIKAALSFWREVR